MKTKRVIFPSLGVCIALSVVMLVPGCPKRQPPEKHADASETPEAAAPKQSGAVRLGAVLLLSGDNALWGKNARNAIDLLKDDINSAGGVGGKKVEVVYEDSRGEPKTAVSALTKLTEMDRVPVVLGDMLTSTTLAMAPLANEREVPLIGISCSAPAVTEAGPYVYRVWPSDLLEGEISAEWSMKKGFRKAAIVYLNNDYGDGLRGAFRRKFEELGGAIVAEEAFTDEDRDFRNIAGKVSHAKPQLVYIVGYYENSAHIVRQFRGANVPGQFLGTSSAMHEKLVEIAGAAAEGFVCALVNDFDHANLSPQQQSFLDKYKAKYGQDPDWAATHGGDAFLVAVACIKAGASSGPEVKKHLDNQKSFEGVNAGITFDTNGDVINKPIAIQRVVDGKFVSE